MDCLVCVEGEILHMFSVNVQVKESNEAEVMVILDAVWLFLRSYRAKLMVGCNSANAMKWASHFDSRSSQLDVVFLSCSKIGNFYGRCSC